jgi:hypothetical protein
MFKAILQASENFCIHQIRAPYVVKDGINKKRTLIAHIDIDVIDSRKYKVYIASDIKFMQRISKIYLEEDESDEETLIDMLLETTNLIVGSAKVIAEEADKNPFTIGTPHFEKISKFNFEYDEAKIIKIQNDEMIIAIKEL